MVEKHYWRGVMTKKSGITVIIGTWLLFNINTAQAQLPTVDFGNLAGTIGIVTQGITNVQQGIEVITNGSNLNAIIGDAVGTISKFASTVKGYVQDAQQAIEKAKQRIAEGKELYNKYKNEIEDRKAKYQQLLASIPNYTNPNSYDDSSNNHSSSSGNSNSSSSNNSSNQNSSYNNSNQTTSPTVIPQSNSQSNTGRQNTLPSNNGWTGNGQQGGVVDNNGTTYDYTPTYNNTEPEVLDSETLPEEEEPLFDEEEEGAAREETTEEENQPVVSLGRKAFGAPEPTNLAKDIAPTIERTIEDGSAAAKDVEENISKDVESLMQKTPEVSVPENQFRVSPSTLGKRSQNTITLSSKLAFAAETSNSNKGTGYDKNGVFIFNTKYCDKSVDDMLTEQGTRECLVNIINKINNKNSYYASNSLEDCKKMVFETAVALLAEATSLKHEASNYQDTLDEQESFGGNSNNTRDDTQVLAMNYEQTQKLLNKLTTLLSGETILSVTKEICNVSEKVLDPNEVDIDNGGK